eukprot:14379992-Alexandrium_andersonii.AAC.1
MWVRGLPWMKGGASAGVAAHSEKKGKDPLPTGKPGHCYGWDASLGVAWRLKDPKGLNTATDT